jgi:hypothetical protein
MEFRRGTAKVFRGDELLGDVRYQFSLSDDGSVFGAVEEVKPTAQTVVVPRVPMNFLPQSAGISTDLHLSLGDGTVVEFLVVDLDGRIENGRRRTDAENGA